MGKALDQVSRKYKSSVRIYQSWPGSGVQGIALLPFVEFHYMKKNILYVIIIDIVTDRRRLKNRLIKNTDPVKEDL